VDLVVALGGQEHGAAMLGGEFSADAGVHLADAIDHHVQARVRARMLGHRHGPAPQPFDGQGGQMLGPHRRWRGNHGRAGAPMMTFIFGDPMNQAAKRLRGWRRPCR
jgi:hypothetical protein